MSVSRRDVVLGAGLLAGAAGAAALTPRNHLRLLGDRNLESLVPKTIGEWRLSPSQSVVLPKAEGSLMAKLYSQVVSRVYESPRDPPMMLVIAYGDTQSDLLQLHRPEACYSAVGFQIRRSTPISVDLKPGAVVTAREVIATRDERVEPIIYWTRIGDFLPDSAGRQRWVKLQNEINGYVTDGVLVRTSTVGDPTPELVGAIERFMATMVDGMAPNARAILVGRPLAAAMARA